MAENATLNAALREEQGKSAARRLRREGRIPAVVYGRGEETRSLTVDAHEFQMLMKKHALDTTLVELTIEGQGRRKATNLRALVSEVQSHPYKDVVLHVDFQQIHAGERVHVELPIRLVGTATGVREGGVLQHILHEISIECAVESIPDAIEVDVSGLDIGDSVHVSDLTVPEGVEIMVEGERTVCTVAAPTVLEAPEEEEEAVAAEPELVGEEAGETVAEAESPEESDEEE